jgi:hypothetical protein
MPTPTGPLLASHPDVAGSRVRERVLLALAAVACVAISLGIVVAEPHPSLGLLFAIAAGAVAVAVLITSSRLEVTVMLVVLYLGLLDGPVKLGSGGHEAATVVRDILIFSVAIGALLRLLVGKVRVTLPPLSGWVLAFIALVLVEAFNPKTNGILKALGGFRQQLEFVPFFFFGYALMRSKERFRRAFVILGVLALANGAVSLYQTKLSPGQLASWGPGYSELVNGTSGPGEGSKSSGEASKSGVSARGYTSEGTARIRPPGLGKDSGFAGGLGMIALPCMLALVATGGRRRRAAAVLLCLGAVLGVVTGLGRLQVVGAVLAVIAFALLSAGAGRQITRPLLAILGVLMLAVPLGAVLVAVEAPGTFNRYAEIAPGNAVGAKDKKTAELSKLPHQLAVAPFGVGLATAGAAAGFGGKGGEVFEGHGVGGETVYNYLGDEVGVPGLALWLALVLYLILLAVRRLRYIEDVELRIQLTAVFAVLVGFFLVGVSGPVMGSAAFASFFWFTTGIAAYWLAPRRTTVSPAPSPAPQPG